MSIIATIKGCKIVILSGQRRLDALLDASGSATIELNGSEVVVEYNDQKEIVLRDINTETSAFNHLDPDGSKAKEMLDLLEKSGRSNDLHLLNFKQ